MTSPAAGSRPRPVTPGKQRATIHGQVIIASPEALAKFRRLSTITLSHVYMQVREQGSAMIQVDDEPWTLSRQPDHTFTLEQGTPHRFSL